ncbi:MAG: hypothetical protein ABIG71_02360 [Candidatus Uhrbacteria bacterium]
MAEKQPFTTELIARLAVERGIAVSLEPTYGHVGQLVLPNGRRCSFSNTSIDANAFGSAELARDKAYALHFLRAAGLPTVESQTFFAPRWARAMASDRTPSAALSYARTVGFPVYVKPNHLCQGREVYCTDDANAFMEAVGRIVQLDRVFLVQRPVVGRDLRVVVVGDVVALAYERFPVAVVGDGTATIAMLLHAKRRALRDQHRHVKLRTNDVRIDACLLRQGLRRTSVPTASTRVPLLDVVNCSTGGDAMDCTDTLNPSLRDLAVCATHSLGLSFAGVDIIVAEDGSATLLEVNASPGLEHYARSSDTAMARVEACYRLVLERLCRGVDVLSPVALPGRIL